MVEKIVQASNSLNIEWNCTPTWRKASYNTSWCLLGCSIGDMGTILYFQLMEIDWPVFLIMALAVFNGLVTSIVLETIILYKQMGLKLGLKTALGMSLISMISMEVAMNTVDVVFAGGVLVWWVIPYMLLAGFITPLPYNYYRLKKYNIACH